MEVNVTDPPPTTPPPPPLVPVLPDDRPSAKVLGSFGLTMIISLLVVFIVMDLPAYHRDLKMMRRNLFSFYQYYCGRHRRRRKRNAKDQLNSNGLRWAASKDSIVLTSWDILRMTTVVAWKSLWETIGLSVGENY